MTQVTQRNLDKRLVHCKNCGQSVMFYPSYYAIFNIDGTIHVGCKSNIKTYKIDKDGKEIEVKFKILPGLGLKCRRCRKRIKFDDGQINKYSGKKIPLNMDGTPHNNTCELKVQTYNRKMKQTKQMLDGNN